MNWKARYSFGPYGLERILSSDDAQDILQKLAWYGTVCTKSLPSPIAELAGDYWVVTYHHDCYYIIDLDACYDWTRNGNKARTEKGRQTEEPAGSTGNPGSGFDSSRPGQTGFVGIPES